MKKETNRDALTKPAILHALQLLPDEKARLHLESWEVASLKLPLGGNTSGIFPFPFC